MTSAAETAEGYDVVIIGAGISGIGAAYRIAERNPATRYLILERRERVGGTWDLFRYPGVRSDSSIYTLCWPWAPWPGEEYVAEGDRIRDYMEDAAHRHGIYQNIRFRTRVKSADWDSASDTWIIQATTDGKPITYRTRFVFFGSGYYSYDDPYTPEFPGLDRFAGTIVHPQHWPDDLDYSGKTVVVIGSGATAVSMVPALARTAGKVVMLQRSPGYLFSMPRRNLLMEPFRKLLPPKLSYPIIRAVAMLFEKFIWVLARGAPGFTRKLVRWQNSSMLPAGYPVDTDFRPRYNPWDERMCLVTDGDVFEAIRRGRLEVITDHVDQIDATGITLKSGRHVDADIIVTATGLQLLALGGVRVSLDGAEIKPQDRFSYKAHMLDGVPNLFWCIGYTNASWTLRADMTARSAARLIDHMNAHGYTHAYPRLGGEPMPEKPTWDLQAGYVMRSLHALPKSGTRRPWVVRQDYFADALDHRFIDRIDEDMVFGRARQQASLAR
ncbi:MAG: NAD(P)/FAD-dependent oxidoreductase [Mycobacteriaceae bacterium]|nr:NAD(P)/FAD-dependent oxidoreductase [Mycobacteriaceae bacterium]